MKKIFEKRNINRESVVFSCGFHPPWNMGEAVYSRNIAKLLSRIYNKTTVISTKDKDRGEFNYPQIEEDLDIKYCSKESFNRIMTAYLVKKEKTDFHFLNAPISEQLKSMRRWGDNSVYFYQFAYSLLGNLNLILRANGITFLSQFLPLKVGTTSIRAYEKLSKILRKNYFLIRPPIDIPSKKKISLYQGDRPLGILYLGHGSYLRFPYRNVFKALKESKSLKNGVRLKIIISTHEYSDYNSFAKRLSKATDKFGVNEITDIRIENISEEEKYRVLAESDIFLFPSFTDTAIDPPASILEAMASGCCVISTPVQSIHSLLKKDRGILLRKEALGRDLSTALRRMIANPDILDEYKSNARNYILETHSIISAAEKIKGILMSSG